MPDRCPGCTMPTCECGTARTWPTVVLVAGVLLALGALGAWAALKVVTS